jgi:hypothetical protein
MDQLISIQRVNCPNNKKLSEKDLKRILTRTGGIYNDNNECIIWNGYITHNKIDYVNFYFNGKKCALHRLLYINFKGKLNDNDYLEYICENKGKCCNINHIFKKKHLSKNNNDQNIVYFD